MFLPGQDDFYDVDLFNENTRLIDCVMRRQLPKELAVTLLGSGPFRPADHGLQGALVDVYMVGGGGGGASVQSQAQLGGGGGGHAVLLRDVALSEVNYNIVIGTGGNINTNGGSTTGFGRSAPGGVRGNSMDGGDGGSGGGSGTGGAGGSLGGPGGSPQGTAGAGAGVVNFTPFNVYDGIAYGCGGGASTGSGGGAGGRPGRIAAIQDSLASLGGGGGHTSHAGARGGNGLLYIYAAPVLSSVAAHRGMVGDALPATFAQRSDELSAATFCGNLTPAEIMVCDAEAKAHVVNIGILKSGTCIDTAVFCSVETARDFLESGVWPEADAVTVLPEGFGIGDAFGGGSWTKQVVEDREMEDAAHLEAL